MNEDKTAEREPRVSSRACVRTASARSLAREHHFIRIRDFTLKAVRSLSAASATTTSSADNVPCLLFQGLPLIHSDTGASDTPATVTVLPPPNGVYILLKMTG